MVYEKTTTRCHVAVEGQIWFLCHSVCYSRVFMLNHRLFAQGV